MQLFVCPMKGVGDIPKAVKMFFKRIGVPDAIICDGHKSQVQGEARKLCQQAGCIIRQLEANTPWSNRAELYVGLFKESVRKELKRTHCPLVLWDYCAEHQAMVNNATAKDLFQLQGQTPFFSVMHEEADISNICQFAFYDWCYYRESTAKFPFPSECLGRILGPSQTVGNEMCQWILRVDGKVVPRHTCRPLTLEEELSNTESSKRAAFDLAITRKLGDSIVIPESRDDDKVFDEYEDDEEEARILPEADDVSYDDLINAEVNLPHRGDLSMATVIGVSRDSDGKRKGRYNANPIVNSQVYGVMFPDGVVKEYAANAIAENIWSQVDE